MLEAILMMLYAYSEEPESWLGQILTPFFEGIMELVAGDYLETTTLADLLAQSPDSEMGFIERQVYNRFENKLADILGVEDESQLNALLSQGDAMNEALIAAGVDTSITVQQMRDMTPEQLRTQIFTPEVMIKLAQNEQFAPLIANVVTNNPDILSSVIPVEYHGLLTDHNKALLQEVMADIDPTRYTEFADIFNSLASGNVDLKAMAEMAQHDDLIAAIRTLSAEGTGLQIPKGFMVGDVDISAKLQQAFAFLRAPGNIEALQAFAPTLREYPELAEKMRSIFEAGDDAESKLEALVDYLKLDENKDLALGSADFLESIDINDLVLELDISVWKRAAAMSMPKGIAEELREHHNPEKARLDIDIPQEEILSPADTPTVDMATIGQAANSALSALGFGR